MKLRPAPFEKLRYHTTRPVLSITSPYRPAAKTTYPGVGSEPLAAKRGRSAGSEPVVKVSGSPSVVPPAPYATARKTYWPSGMSPNTGIATDSPVTITAGVTLETAADSSRRLKRTTTLSARLIPTDTIALNTLCSSAAAIADTICGGFG